MARWFVANLDADEDRLRQKYDACCFSGVFQVASPFDDSNDHVEQPNDSRFQSLRQCFRGDWLFRIGQGLEIQAVEIIILQEDFVFQLRFFQDPVDQLLYNVKVLADIFKVFTYLDMLQVSVFAEQGGNGFDFLIGSRVFQLDMAVGPIGKNKKVVAIRF